MKLFLAMAALSGAAFCQTYPGWIAYKVLHPGDPRATIRVKAGASDLIDSAGHYWKGMYFACYRGRCTSPAEDGYYSQDYAVDTTTSALPAFAGTIYAEQQPGDFVIPVFFSFSVPIGTYKIRISVADYDCAAVGCRIFAVSWKDGTGTLQTLDASVDVFARVGQNTPLVLEYSGIATATGKITVQMLRNFGGGLTSVMNGIEILPDGPAPSTLDFSGAEGYGLFFDGVDSTWYPLAGLPGPLEKSFFRITGNYAGGLATGLKHCYIWADSATPASPLLTGSGTADDCVIDFSGVIANGTTALSGFTSITHSILLPTMLGQPVTLADAGQDGSHNTCYGTCGFTSDDSLEWAPGSGSTDPQWYDPKRNLALFDGKYLGNTATAWSASATYTAGQFASHAKPEMHWGETVNFRYTNGAGCSTSNPEPMVAATWRACWEYASLYRLRQAYPDPTASPGRGVLDVIDDQSIGAHGDELGVVLLKWVQAGYAPTNYDLMGSASDQYDPGAVPVVLETPLSSLASMVPALIFGGRLQMGGKVEVMR